MLRDVQRRGQRAVISPLPPSRPHGDASLLQGTPDRARRHPQLGGYAVRGLTSGIELGGPVDLVALERPAIPHGDPATPDVPEHRRPVDPERCGQLLHRDTPTVRGDQLGYLVRCKAPLNRQRPNERVGRANRMLAGGLPQHRPQSRQAEQMAIYLGKRTTTRQRGSSRIVTR